MPFVGRKLRLKILAVNRKANRLFLSEKVALYEERREKRDELFSSLQVGQKVTGTVRSIVLFGVLIDLGGIDGLVHKSELSWNKVNNPEAGYKVGEEVEAEVIDINPSAAGPASRSAGSSLFRGIPRSPTSTSTTSSTARSPRSSTSAPSSASATASRASSTSASCPTSESPTRATSCTRASR